MKNFFSFITLFWLVFDLKLIGSLGSAFLTLTFCLGILILNPKKYYSNISNVLDCFGYFILSYLIFLIYIFLRVVISGADEINYLLTTLKTTLILIAAFFYVIVFYESDIKSNFINIFFLNSCICLFFGIYTELKVYLEPFQYGADEVSELLGSNPFRNSFLAGSGYFGISSLYGLAFAFCLKLIIDDKEKNNFNYLKLLLIAIAGIFAGRVALVCYFIAILYFLFIKVEFKVLVSALFSCFLFIFLINSIVAFEGVKIWFDEMFFNNSINQSESVSQFKDSFDLPINELTLLFGDAKYGSSTSYYGGSDSGYIRNIYFGGVVYLLILLSSFFLIFYKVRKNLYIYVFLSICLFLHLKGVFIFNNPGFWGVILLVCTYFHKEKNVRFSRN